MGSRARLDDGPATVISAIDSSDGHPTYVIADISADDAWVSIEAGAARPLNEWR